MKDQYGENVLQEMVIVKVLGDKYNVSDKEVDKKVKTIKDQLGDQFQGYLQQQGYADEKDFRNQVKNSLLMEKAIFSNVKVTDKEMKEQYNRMKTDLKASHILVKDEKTAKDVQKKLDKGEDFAKLAKKYSTDTASAEKGGELGWFSAGSMVPQFEDAAYKMKKGEISKPVKSDYGYHIIKLEDTRKSENDVGSFEDNKDKIKNDVRNQKLPSDKQQEKLNKILKDADIKIEIKQFKDMFKDLDKQTKAAQ
ncbi:peptidylprolyl isomerase [Virgibacillus halophilus]|uniref:Foldase protein PrsA n=2 Tax=Tigheibacillus halophilus TaxID=361280 RepID=A0ABU5C9J7_9BACI|nr:peptidylprolyl isomerase [Virgibacillus halophilus]